MNYTNFSNLNLSDRILKKIENEENMWNYVNNKKTYIPYFPPRITFITSKRCNLSCRFCYHFRHKYMNNISPLNMPVMDTRLIYKVAEELFPTLQYYETTLLGDPFLSPSLETEIELASRHDVYMRPTTNGTTLTDRNLDLVSGHMDWLKCSFDSHIRGVYNSIRIGARFENTIKKLQNFVRRRESMNPMPYFRMGLVLNDLNVEEIPDYFLWCHEYMGVDDVEIMGLNVDADHIESLAVFDKPAIVNKALDRVIDNALTKKYKLRLDFTQMPEPGGDRFVCQKRSQELRAAQQPYGFVPPRNFEKMSYIMQNPRNYWEIGDVGYVWSNNMREQSICVEFMNRPFVLDNGNVEVCGNCNTFTPGNLKHQSFAEIWNNSMYRHIRKTMYHGTIKKDWPDACNDCICMSVTYDRGRSDHRHKPFYRVTDIDKNGRENRVPVGETHGKKDFFDVYETGAYIQDIENRKNYTRVNYGADCVYLGDLHTAEEREKSGICYDKVNIFTPIMLDAMLYSHGLFMLSGKIAIFSIPEGMKKFKAFIGYFDNTNPNRHILYDGNFAKLDVYFSVECDGKQMYRSPAMQYNTKSEEICLDITGIKTLRLITSNVDKHEKSCAWLVWSNARFE